MKTNSLLGGLALACLFAVLASFGFASEAWAAVAPTADPAATTVRFPWGEYAAALITAGGGLATWLITRAVGLMPGPAQLAIKITKLDQVGRRVIEAAAFDLAEKIKKEGYSVNVRNELLAKALNGFQVQAGQLAREFQGTLVLKLKARLEEYIAEKTRASAG
jgi:hypothetical protein